MTNTNLVSLLSSPLDIDPVYFVQNARTIDGDPFVIEGNGREYLVDFYRYLCIGAIKDRKPVVVVKGRQVEMTEAALNVSLYFLCNYKFFNVLHAFPTKDQTSRYSKERLQGAIRFSKDGKISKMLADHKNASDTVSIVEFKNQNFYYMYSAWAEADSLRGISVDALMRDEFQDWNDGAIANTDAATARSKYAVEFSFGTPKAAGAPFEKLWELSDQRYYHSRCVRCSELFRITMDNSLHSDVVKCTHCGCEQRKKDANKNGKWIATRPLTSTGRVGYHISQLIHPEIRIEDILRRKAEYSDSKFKNEVLGEFFTGGARPIDKRDFIERCCMPYRDQDFPYMVAAPQETFMGIDWGSRNELNDSGAFTVVTIIGKNRITDKYEVKFTEKLTSPEYLKQVARIKELITLYNCVSIVADSGYGQVQCQILQSEYGPRVKSAYYAPNSKNKLSYNEETWMITIDRNAFIEEIIDIINRGNLVFPWRSAAKNEWFIDQVCNVEIKLTQKTGNVFKSYEKVDTREPNDALHSLNYAYIASIMHLGQGALSRTAATSKNQQSITGMMLGANFNGRPAKQSRSSMPLFTRDGYRQR
jgi:hypothetical protein